MNLFGVMDISASALLAQRQRAEVVTSNLANADSSAPTAAGVYQRQQVVFSSEQLPFAQVLAQAGGPANTDTPGVAVTGVVSANQPPIQRYEPGNANAGPDGYVDYPNIDPVEEMTDLMEAARSYQLNATAVEASKNMIQRSLSILR